MSTVNVGWVQINNSFSGQSYLPLSVGFLQAYAQHHARSPERYRFLPAIYRREPVSRAVHKLSEADIIGFSVYVWNRNLSLEIARRLKVERPDRLVVFGGPQVPDRAELFLREHPWVDLVCHGEGEPVFLQVLERFPDRDWTGIQALSYLSPSGRFVHQPRVSRMVDLAEIPSPFLRGVFEPLMSDSEAGQWLGLWETNRGCPFSCAFCEWGAESLNRIVPFDMERLQKEMEWFADHRIEFIFCCDANFGLLPRDVDIARVVARVKHERGYPHAFSIQGAKLASDRVFEIHKVLAESGMSKGALVALQSVNPPTLKAVGRANIPLKTFDQLQGRLRQEGIQTFTDIREHPLERQILGRFAQTGQRAQNRHPGFKQCVHLPAEHHDINLADLAFGQFESPTGISHRYRFTGNDNLYRRNPATEQLIGDCPTAGALQHATHHLAIGIAPLIGKERHFPLRQG